MDTLLNLVVLVVIGKIAIAALWIGLQIAMQSVWGLICLMFFASVGALVISLS